MPGGFFVGRQQCPHIGALVPDDLCQKTVDERLDLVGTENRREVRSGRWRTFGKAVAGALRVGAVEPTGHLRAWKSAADGLDEGYAIKLRLAQARASRKFAAGAAGQLDEVNREVIAGRIVAAARRDERDPARLREAAFTNEASAGKGLARREPWRGIVGHPGPGVFIPRQIFRLYSG